MAFYFLRSGTLWDPDGGGHLALGSWFPGTSPFGTGVNSTTMEFWIDMDSLLLAVITSI